MTVSLKPATYAPTSARGVHALSLNAPKKPVNPRQEFMMAALNMSWQLAVVVLGPIFVGYYLDGRFGTLPLWTTVGFILAMIMMGLVVRRQVKLLSPKITQDDIENARKIREAEEREEEDK